MYRAIPAILLIFVTACSTTTGAPPSSTAATSSATASTTPTEEPEPTPTPTPEGAGIITFGTAFDPDTLEITKPKEAFTAKEEIAWSAYLIEPVGATSVTFILAKVSKGGSESIQLSQDIDVSSPDSDVFANKVALGDLLDGKGTYVMRYVRGGTVLAEGRFTIK
jgi:hypothetical protein